MEKEVKKELDELASTYKEICDRFSAVEAEKKAYNGMIKRMMADNDIKKYVSKSGISLSVTTSNRTTYDEDGLLGFARTSDVDGLIITKEYVDMDALESAIYHNKIDRASIKPFIKVTIVEALKCTQKEPLTE